MSAPDYLDRYVSAIQSFERIVDPWAGVRCQHGVALSADCDECEPILDGGESNA